MKKTLLAAGVSLALGFSAGAYAAISFDTNGAAGGGQILTDTFDWVPGNLLFENINNAGNPSTKAFDLYGHGSLGAWLLGGAPVASPTGTGEFTYVFHTSMGATLQAFVPGSVTLWTLTSLGGGAAGGTSTFEVYFDNNAGTTANTITGSGFADGQLVLQGSLLNSAVAGGAGSLNVTVDPSNPKPNLDGFGLNNQAPITTDIVGGNLSFDIDVTYADDNFFLTDVTSDILGLDMDLSSQVKAAFDQTNPADVVAGVAGETSVFNAGSAWGATAGAVGPFNKLPNYGGDNINDINCNAGPCDIHAQSDASSTFSAQAPEPTSLALLGLGLVGFGLSRRGRGSRA